MPTPIHNPFFKYTITFPDGRTQTRAGSVTGWVSDMQWLEDTLLHGKPIEAQLTSVVATNKRGAPLKSQPDIFAAHTVKIKARMASKKKPTELDPRLAAIHEQDPDAKHPGVQEWTPQSPSNESFDEVPESTMEPVKPIVDESRVVQPSGPQGVGIPKTMKDA